MSDAFDVGATQGLVGGALVPALVFFFAAAPFFGVEESVSLAWFVFSVLFLPARLAGGLVARHLSRFVYLDSPRRLKAQGALIGAAAGIVGYGLPVSAWTAVSHAPTPVLVIAGAAGVLSGALAGLLAAQALARRAVVRIGS